MLCHCCLSLSRPSPPITCDAVLSHGRVLDKLAKMAWRDVSDTRSELLRDKRQGTTSLVAGTKRPSFCETGCPRTNEEAADQAALTERISINCGSTPLRAVGNEPSREERGDTNRISATARLHA